MNINWYPGHMVKTKRLITENLKLVDVVIELIDSRIPYSSKNPEVDKLIGEKPKLVVLNKSDLADDKISKEWINNYKKKGIKAILVDSVKGIGLKEVVKASRELAQTRLQHEKSKGRLPRAVRVMVIGIPNVGKSSFINKFVGNSPAKTGNKPGVTRGKQWIRISNDLELLDMPGILWPKFDDEAVGLKLAYTGAVKDEIIDIVELAGKLIEYLANLYPEELKKRYKLNDINFDGLDLLNEIGKKRGALVSGGEVDQNRIAQIIIDEFRVAKIGRMSLERP